MATDQLAISIMILITFGLFIWGKLRHDIVSLLALFSLVVVDSILGGETSNLVTDPAQIFLGFGHPAVITVAAVLVISRALRNSGVVDIIAKYLHPFTKKQTTHIASIGSVIAILSAFMNNVGALALMLPVTLKTAWKQKRSPSILLMPIAFISILGGMITMIGTPPNIIISNLRLELQQSIMSAALSDSSSASAQYIKKLEISPDNFVPQAFALFDFTPVGAIIALCGTLFIALIGWRLVPKDNQVKPKADSLFSLEEYVTEMRIAKTSSLIGKTVIDANKDLGKDIQIIRHINGQYAKSLKTNHIIKHDDRFLIMGDPKNLKETMDKYGLQLTKEMSSRIDALKEGDSIFVETVITPDSPLLGRDRTYLRRRSSNQLTLVAVARQNKPIHKRLGNIKFAIGDVLLLQGSEEATKDNIRSLDLLPLAEREIEVGALKKVTYALSVFAIAILLSMFSILPTTIAFIGAILIYTISGILPLRDLYKNIDWPIIVLLGAMIPLSNALQSTGTSSLVANHIINITQGLPSWVIISLIMFVTMCLSDIINNAATALIMGPISAGIAISLGVSIDPFLMSVAIGASCAFLTPIGHQCNALVLGPGGYRFGDYWRMGLPLEIMIIIIGTPAILYFWPL